MNKKRSTLLHKHERMIQQVGEQFKSARLRRKLSAEQVPIKFINRYLEQVYISCHQLLKKLVWLCQHVFILPT